jgi:hypothetical protein
VNAPELPLEVIEASHGGIARADSSPVVGRDAFVLEVQEVPPVEQSVELRNRSFVRAISSGQGSR